MVSAWSHKIYVGSNSSVDGLDFFLHFFSLVFLRKLVLDAQTKPAGTYTQLQGSGPVVCTVDCWFAGVDSNPIPIILHFLSLVLLRKLVFHAQTIPEALL